MNRKTYGTLLVFLLLITGITQAQETSSDFPVLKGPYLGQKPPGMTPELFAPGIISKEETSQSCSVFSPYGNEFYFRRANRGIMCMKRINNNWTKPEVVSFSGEYIDFDISLSQDGYRFFFCSRRPLPGNTEPEDRTYIWYAARDKNGWGDPQPVKYSGDNYLRAVYPTLDNDGSLYFTARLNETFGSGDIYRLRFINGSYGDPENLGRNINTKYPESDPFIAPDQSYIIVKCFERTENIGPEDLYISFRKKDGSWTPLKHMGDKINTEVIECCPMVSPDGKYFFFTRGTPERGTIYWVDAKIFDQFKPKNMQ